MSFHKTYHFGIKNNTQFTWNLLSIYVSSFEDLIWLKISSKVGDRIQILVPAFLVFAHLMIWV